MLRIVHTAALVVLLSGGAHAQTPPSAGPPTGALQVVSTAPHVDTTALARVEEAFRTGDAALLLEDAADRVEVVVFGRGAAYSQSQAALVLLDFFRRHPAERVAFEEQVLGQDRQSVIGRYWIDTTATPLAVTVRLHAHADGWQLRAVRLERPMR